MIQNRRRAMTRYLRAVALAGALLIGAGGALSEAAVPAPACVPASQAIRALHDRFGETVRWVGRDEFGTEDVLTEAPSGKTWTLLAIGADAHGHAVACMLDSGGTTKKAAAA